MHDHELVLTGLSFQEAPLTVTGSSVGKGGIVVIRMVV